MSRNRYRTFGRLAGLLGCLALANAASAATLARWDFEDLNTTVDEGAGTMSSSHTTGESYSAGNASVAAYSLTSWAITDVRTTYFQFDIPTTGRTNIRMSVDERRSGTGITSMEMYYSTDGTNFVVFPGSLRTVPDDTAFRTQVFDFSTITALNNNPNAKFRLHGFLAESSGGTWRIDNVLFDESTGPIQGGCCVGGSCSLTGSLAECCALNGLYLGNDTTCAGGCPSFAAIVINEIRIDQSGADADEYFEISGPAGASLTGLTFLVIGDSGTAGSGVIESVVSLNGKSIPPDGYFLVAEDADTCSQVADFVTPFNFENDDNITYLLVSGFCGTDNQDLDTNDDGTLDVSPWASRVDSIALIQEQNPPVLTEWHYGPPSLGPDGMLQPKHAYRLPDGPSGTWTIGVTDPVCTDDTAGLLNAFGACCSGSGQSTCGVRSLAECQSLGGSFKGPNTTCTQNICLGACCVSGACSSMSLTTCQSAGGNYFGDGAPCPTSGTCCRTPTEARDLRITLGYDTGVRLCNVVVNSVVNVVETVENKSFHIQPDNGPGAQIFGPAEVIDVLLANGTDPIRAGDRIDIDGMTGDFRGLFEIVNGTTPLRLIDRGFQAAPTPTPVTMATFTDPVAAELVESRLVSLDCVSFLGRAPGETFSSATSYSVTDGTNLVEVRVTTVSTGLVGQPIPTNITKLTGIFTQRSTDTSPGYRLFLLSTSNGTCVPAAGACCMPDGTCRTATQAICTGQEGVLGHGGVYRGNGTTCPAGCTPFTGACCVGESCQVRSRADCLSAEGVYIGDNAPCPAICPNPTRTLINELRLDQAGADNDEYIELKAAGGTPLDSLTYLVIGDNTSASPFGIIEKVLPLTGISVPQDGLLLIGESTFNSALFGDVVDVVRTLDFENTDNQTHLLVNNFIGANGDDLDLDDDGVLDIRPWDSQVTCISIVGPSGGDMTYCNFTVGPTETDTVPMHIKACDGVPGGYLVGGGDTPTVGVDTPGTPNVCPGACPCFGDVNGSGRIDAGDIPAFASGLTAITPEPCTNANADGAADGRDVSAFITLVMANAGAGTACQTPPGPEDYRIQQCAQGDPACAVQSGVSRFCQYRVSDDQTQNGMDMALNNCVLDAHVLNAFERACIVCPNPLPSGLCGALGTNPFIFRWQAPSGGPDCFFFAAPIISTCNDCATALNPKLFQFAP